MEREFGGNDVLKITGATKTQLNYWIRAGAVVPEVDAHGSGRKRTYSLRNLIEVGVCMALADYSVPPSVMKAATDMLRTPCLLKVNREYTFSSNPQNRPALTFYEFRREEPRGRLFLVVARSSQEKYQVMLYTPREFSVLIDTQNDNASRYNVPQSLLFLAAANPAILVVEMGTLIDRLRRVILA